MRQARLAFVREIPVHAARHHRPSVHSPLFGRTADKLPVLARPARHAGLPLLEAPDDCRQRAQGRTAHALVGARCSAHVRVRLRAHHVLQRARNVRQLPRRAVLGLHHAHDRRLRRRLPDDRPRKNRRHDLLVLRHGGHRYARRRYHQRFFAAGPQDAARPRRVFRPYTPRSAHSFRRNSCTPSRRNSRLDERPPPRMHVPCHHGSVHAARHCALRSAHGFRPAAVA